MRDFLRVLIVEDDPMVANVNKRYVERAGPFQVVGMVASGEGAIRAVQDKQPDLVLLDVYLPRGNGLEVLESIRRTNVAVDVILITAAQDVDTVEQALRYGAVDYIIKPFDFARLAVALSAYRERRKRLAVRDELAQPEIDRLVMGMGADAVLPALPKGLDPYTLEQVRCYLQPGEAFSAQEVATGLDLSRITARRYLEYLVMCGEALVELDHVSVGRPVKRYRWS
ncbi:MAG: response regulator [Firmicutes bacterium]|nr:response regulator [Bacillota bacterium]